MSAEMGATAPEESPRSRPRRRRRKQFQIGRVLGTGISIWISGLPAYLALTVIVFAPYALLRWSFEVSRPLGQNTWVYAGVTQLLQQLLSLVVSATVIYAVFQRLRGRRVGMLASIAYGLGRLPAVIGVSLLVGLVFALIWSPVFALALADVPAGAGLLAIPALVVFAVAQCGLWVAVPACVVEQPGLVESLRRSWALTKGSKGAIFLLLLLFGIFGAVLGVLVTLPVMVIVGDGSIWTELGLSLGLTVVVTSMTAVVTAVGYHELRLAVDGIDPDELAAIFD